MKFNEKFFPSKELWTKPILIMKMIILLIVAFCLQANATGQRLTIAKKNVSLKEVFTEIENQSGYLFVYETGTIDANMKATVDVRNADINRTVRELLEGQPLTYNIVGKMIVVQHKKNISAKAKYEAPPPPIDVTGRVVDSEGNAIAGVTITERGTSNATATDDNGLFILKNIKTSSTIEVTNIGYYSLLFRVVVNPKIANVGDGSRLTFRAVLLGSDQKEVNEMNINLNKLPDTAGKESYIKNSDLGVLIVLARKFSDLDDIAIKVNTGYQTLSRERSAGSFSTVSGEAVTKKANLTSNILETLEGLAPGLSVNYGTGEDKFLIRGTTSVNSSKDPLIVVDGVIMEDANIESLVNSTDVESVTFLKDATAASIWGARSANGVIVITTKRGKVGQRKIKIGYDGSYTNKGLPDIGYRGLMNSSQFIQSAREIFDPVNNKWATITSWSGGALVYPHELPLYKYDNGEISEKERDDLLNTLASQNNIAQLKKYLMQPTSFSKHTISFEGGSDLYSFYGSTGYEYNQQTNLSKTNKYSINFRQNFQLAKWFKIDLLTNLNVQNGNTGITPAHTDWKSIFPYEMLADAQGNPIDQTNGLFYPDYQKQMEQQSGLDLTYVPLLDMKEGFNRSKGFNGRINLGLTINLAKGLQYQGRFQYQESNSQTELLIV